jgi:hypothetical protein
LSSKSSKEGGEPRLQQIPRTKKERAAVAPDVLARDYHQQIPQHRNNVAPVPPERDFVPRTARKSAVQPVEDKLVCTSLIRQPRILCGNGVVIGPAIRQQRICQLSMKSVNYPHPIKPDNEMERDDILSLFSPTVI